MIFNVLLCLAGLNYFTKGSFLEKQLRDEILTDYNKFVRPVAQYNDTLDVTLGLAVQNIESFNQIQETIQLNIWLRKYWTNGLLSWDLNDFDISQLTLDNSEVWTPDVELINAATIPDIYTLKGGMYLYNDGSMLWSMPSVYKFSCALQLEDFPFDTQDCSMKFGSWTYDNQLLSLKPHGTESTQIDVLDSFSHSEWQLDRYYVTHYNETRDCCGDKLFDINEYHFILSRYSHYYKLNMGMTISLVVVSFIIMLIKPDNLSRTGTAVFIPLTILALQLTIADKIPVVGYYTLMDQFFLTCFITSMIVSIESGIVYTMITSKSDMIFKAFDRCIDYNKILKRLREDKLARIDTQNQHDDFIRIKKQSVLPVLNIANSTITHVNGRKLVETDLDSAEKTVGSVVEDEFTATANALNRLAGVTNNGNNANNANNGNNANNANNENLSVTELRQRRKTRIENINREIQKDNDVVEKDVLKVIQFDNKNLSLTYKEYLLFNEVTRIFGILDNVFRFILPFSFFIIMGVIFSYENN